MSPPDMSPVYKPLQDPLRTYIKWGFNKGFYGVDGDNRTLAEL